LAGGKDSEQAKWMGHLILHREFGHTDANCTIPFALRVIKWP